MFPIELCHRHLGHAFDGRTCIGVIDGTDAPHSMDMCAKPEQDTLRRPVAPATVEEAESIARLMTDKSEAFAWIRPSLHAGAVGNNSRLFRD